MKHALKTAARLALVLMVAVASAVWVAPIDSRPSAIARHFPLNDLTETAHRIVHATVISESPAYNSTRTQIWTTWGLRVTETLKDAATVGFDMAAGTVAAHTRGGTVGEISQVTSGEPRLAVGGEYVLFLWKDDAGYWNVVGQTQGALMVVRPEGEVARARNTYRGHRFVFIDGQKVAEKVGPIDHTLSDLVTMVKAQVAVNGGGVAAPAPPPVVVPPNPPTGQNGGEESSSASPQHVSIGASASVATTPTISGRAE